VSDWPILARAPIVEGLLDIQFEPLAAERLPELEAFQALIPEYKEKHPKVTFAGQILLGTQGIANVGQSSTIGYLFRDNDRNRVAQVRLNGFTLSFLQPYTHFAELESEAKRLWGLFQAYVHQPTITRLALRYINRLELPLPFDDFSEYILTYPEIAPKIPQKLYQFEMRAMLPDGDSDRVATVTEVCEPSPLGAPNINVVLDIDVSKSVTEPFEEAQIWQIVEALRDFKNRIFFGTVTEKLLENYK